MRFCFALLFATAIAAPPPDGSSQQGPANPGESFPSNFSVYDIVTHPLNAISLLKRSLHHFYNGLVPKPVENTLKLLKLHLNPRSQPGGDSQRSYQQKIAQQGRYQLGSGGYPSQQGGLQAPGRFPSSQPWNRNTAGSYLQPAQQVPSGYPTGPQNGNYQKGGMYQTVPGSYPQSQQVGYQSGTGRNPQGFQLPPQGGFQSVPSNYPQSQKGSQGSYITAPGGYPTAQTGGYQTASSSYPTRKQGDYQSASSGYPTRKQDDYQSALSSFPTQKQGGYPTAPGRYPQQNTLPRPRFGEYGGSFLPNQRENSPHRKKKSQRKINKVLMKLEDSDSSSDES